LEEASHVSEEHDASNFWVEVTGVGHVGLYRKWEEICSKLNGENKGWAISGPLEEVPFCNTLPSYSLYKANF
jgi:hypothetical protein